MMVLSPSAPEFAPQHHTVFSPPAFFSPHVRLTPIVIALKTLPPCTCTGVALFVSVPFPSCPWKFPPQHHAAPAAVSPQPPAGPAAIFVSLIPPVTSAG